MSKEFKMVMLVAERELNALKKEAYDLASTSPYEKGTFNKLLAVYAEMVKVEEWLRAANAKLNSEQVEWEVVSE